MVALKGAKLSDFGGRSLSAMSATVLQVNPDILEAHMLRGWFDNVGCTAASMSISSQASQGLLNSAYKTFSGAKLENLSRGDNPDYYTVKALVVVVNQKRPLYQECPSQRCNKQTCKHFYHFFSLRLLI